MCINFLKALITVGVIGSLAGCASTSDSTAMTKSVESADLPTPGMAADSMQTLTGMDDTTTTTVSGGSLTDTLVRELGVTPTQASGGAGAIFGVAQTNMSPGEFAQISDAVPDMGSLLSAAPSMEGASALTGGMPGLSGGMPGLSGGMPGLSGGMPGLSGGMPGLSGGSGLGGMAVSTGALSSLAGPFSDLGMSPDMVGKFVPVIMNYLQSSGSPSAASLLQGVLF